MTSDGDEGIYGEPLKDVPGPLNGTRVVEVTSARSGPACVRQLADLGADVIQIAPPGQGGLDGSDGWNLHRNKRSMTVDVRTPGGREIVLRLVSRADVFVENWRPSVKRRLRLEPAAMWAVNPRLIYASISGFGQDGPYADRPGLDQVAQGLGGLMSVTGPPNTGPWRTGIAVSDLAAGTFLTVGILAALIARGRTGRGQWVHTSLLESMVSLMDFQAARWLIDGERPVQTGNQHPTLPGMNTFKTRDGFINVALLTGFDRFFVAIGLPGAADDPRFADDASRRANRADLEAMIQTSLATRSTADWIELLGSDFPCGPVLSVDEVFSDVQVLHLKLTRTVERSPDQMIEILRLPLTFSDTPASVRSGPPVRGLHTEEVLAELGYGPTEVDGFVQGGVVEGLAPR